MIIKSMNLGYYSFCSFTCVVFFDVSLEFLDLGWSSLGCVGLRCTRNRFWGSFWIIYSVHYCFSGRCTVYCSMSSALAMVLMLGISVLSWSFFGGMAINDKCGCGWRAMAVGWSWQDLAGTAFGKTCHWKEFGQVT